MRAALTVIATAMLACACLPSSSFQPTSSFQPVATPEVTSPVEGVIVSVDSRGLNDVRGFVLRASGGFAFDFALGALENPTEFPPGHLAEHQVTSEPVRVYFRLQNGVRLVYRLEDAAPTSPAPSP